MFRQTLERAKQFALGGKELEALELYRPILAEGRANERARAIHGLAALTLPEAEALIIEHLLYDSSVTVRRMAADGLYQLGHISSIPALLKSAEDVDPEVSWKSNQAINIIRNPSYVLEWEREGSIMHLHYTGEVNNAVIIPSCNKMVSMLDHSSEQLCLLMDYTRHTRTLLHSDGLYSALKVFLHPNMGLSVTYGHKFPDRAYQRGVEALRYFMGNRGLRYIDTGTFDEALTMILNYQRARGSTGQ